MHPYKRKRRTRRDMFVLGGWLFADLLLGLAMLFAVANTVGQAPPEPTPTATPDELATSEARAEVAQANNEATIAALEGNVADANTSARQTQVAADEVAAIATEEANAEATRQALSADERAQADALATEEAIAAEGTIAALGTEQASADSDRNALNDELATNVAQATIVAGDVNALSTEQAALQASATENAESGVSSQATVAAAEGQVAASQTEVANAQATSDASGQAVTDAQATADASNQIVADAQATSAALDQQVQLNSLNPQSTIEIIQVDLNGVIDGDGDARADASAALGTALAPYLQGQNCRIGFVNISSRAPDLGSGVQLSTAIGEILFEDFPQLLPEPEEGSSPALASNPIAYPGTEPTGEVELQLFLSTGCQPAEGANVSNPLARHDRPQPYAVRRRPT